MTTTELGMSLIYELTNEQVNERVRTSCMGNYWYLTQKDADTFNIVYIGRSDSDLREEIKSRRTTDTKFDKCTHFCFSYAETSKEAYEKECKDYHTYKPLLNDIHPNKPDGKKYICPICNK